jgi:hypothetical protein
MLKLFFLSLRRQFRWSLAIWWWEIVVLQQLTNWPRGP